MSNSDANSSTNVDAIMSHDENIVANNVEWVQLLKKVFKGGGLMECLTVSSAVNSANGTTPTGGVHKEVSLLQLCLFTS